MARPFYYLRCMALGVTALAMIAVSISHTATAASADFGWTVAPHVYVIDLNVDVAALPATKANINVPTKRLRALPAGAPAAVSRNSHVSFSGGRTGYHMIC